MELFDRKREMVAQQGGRKAEVPLYFCYYDDDVIQTNCFSLLWYTFV